MPDAVVRARDAADVALTMRAASERGVPVTPRGAGTGKVGGAVPARGGIVLSLDRMRAIHEIDRLDGVAVVDPGVITGELHAAAERERLFFGPDPNSWEQCTIGGNVATNASGPRSFKYGATRDWVLGLDIVTGDGTAMSIGRRTSKGVVGYDLPSLIVGSEGTLAIVTRATLRLAALPERVIAVLALLPDESAIAPAIAAAIDARVTPRSIELLDGATLDVVRGASTIPIPDAARALLVLELDGRADAVERDAIALGEAIAALSPFDVLIAQSASERERFWSVRRDMSRALRRSARFKASEDVVVPRSRIAELLARCRAISGEHGIRMPAYGHAGDGNLHVNLLWDREDQRAAVDLAIRALFEAATSLGGTLSGEHGIGLAKAPYLALALAAETRALQLRIKDAFDPRRVLNPGKIFAGDAGHRAC
jgi:glycolate oxidase